MKAKSPEFNCDMLLLRQGNSVLLQKRPAKAIWGGLWSLPESTWRAREKKGLNHLTVKELLTLAFARGGSSCCY
jgi:A/G-specific adenine glycosylase